MFLEENFQIQLLEAPVTMNRIDAGYPDEVVHVYWKANPFLGQNVNVNVRTLSHIDTSFTIGFLFYFKAFYSCQPVTNTEEVPNK